MLSALPMNLPYSRRERVTDDIAPKRASCSRNSDFRHGHSSDVPWGASNPLECPQAIEARPTHSCHAGSHLHRWRFAGFFRFLRF